MNREDLIAAIVFASGAGLLLAAVIVQYMRTKKLPVGYVLSIAGLFCAALTRFPTMQSEAFFWATIALFAISVLVSLVELGLRMRKRNKPQPSDGSPADAAAT